MIGTGKETGASSLLHGNSLAQQYMGTFILELHSDVLAMVSSSLPSFEGNFDPHAYIDWELKVEAEFDKYDMSEKQLIFAASKASTRFALNEWKHICWHNKVPQSWIDYKIMFRDVYIHAYYSDHLLDKLEKLTQRNRIVREYYHDFKICVLFGGFNECMENVMSMFMRGLNSEIHLLLLNETYSHITHLFLLACKAECQILLSAHILAKNDESFCPLYMLINSTK